MCGDTERCHVHDEEGIAGNSHPSDDLGRTGEAGQVDERMVIPFFFIWRGGAKP